MLAFQPDYIKKNPQTVQGVVDGYFDALAMIKSDPKKSYEIMGSKVKQTGEQFEASAKFIAWQDKAANQAYFTGNLQARQAARRGGKEGVRKLRSRWAPYQ